MSQALSAFAFVTICTPFVAGLVLPIESIGVIGNPLPPTARLRLPGGARSLRADCDAYVNASNGPVSTDGGSNSRSIWADDVVAGYEVASRIFDTILLVACRAQQKQERITIWLPNVNRINMVGDFVKVIADNSLRLGGWTAQVEAWPRAPATGISLSWDPTNEDTSTAAQRAPSHDIDDAISSTEAWVENTLGRLGLCPYTASLRRAAIGLESFGVKEGPVVVRHASCSFVFNAESERDDIFPLPTDAAILAASFWQGVVELATKPEDEIATFLIVAPSSYDGNFCGFASTCDNLLEQSCKAVGADDIIGKAWFHPCYNSNVVGQDMILPGHALPANMVKEFVDKYYGDGSPQQRYLDIAAVEMANDAVRHTPHATVNLLRRSQLLASKEAEAAAGAKTPNLIYARNVIRIAAEMLDKN